MYYVYILRSIKDKNSYIGHTNNLQRRIKEHNSKLNQSTKSRVPFKLVCYEAYANLSDAKKREYNLILRAKALAQLLRRIRNSMAS